MKRISESGMVAEHIYIGDETFESSAEPINISGRAQVRNRVDGTFVELDFYEEGFLKVREHRKDKLRKEQLLDLQFLNPNPVTTQHAATGFLRSALACGLLAIATSVAVPTTTYSQYAMSTTAVLGTLAVLLLLFCVYGSRSEHLFQTASGQAVVLTLSSSLGCKRQVRDIALNIRRSIVEASRGTDSCDVRYLRAEMQAHYKLAETGVISRQACSDSTKLILSKFG